MHNVVRVPRSALCARLRTTPCREPAIDLRRLRASIQHEGMNDTVLEVDPRTLLPLRGVRPERHRAAILDLTLEELASGALPLPVVLEDSGQPGTYQVVTLDRARAAALRAGLPAVTVRLRADLAHDRLLTVTLHYEALLADAHTRPIERIRSALDLLGITVLWDSRVPELLDEPDERVRVAVEALTTYRRYRAGRPTPFTAELGFDPTDLARLVDEVSRTSVGIGPTTFASHWLPLLDAPDPIKQALTQGRITMAQAERLVRHPDPAIIEALQAGGAAPSSRAMVGKRPGTPPSSTNQPDAEAGPPEALTESLAAATTFLQHLPDLTANERRKVARIVTELVELANRYAR